MALPVALVLPLPDAAVFSPVSVIPAVPVDVARPLAEPLPSPVRAPATELFAPEDIVDPMAAVALPLEPYEPVATSPPLLVPFTLPWLVEVLLIPAGVLVATPTPCEVPATLPVPGPETAPIVLEFAVAPSAPFVAFAVPLAPNEAVPPLADAWPVEVELAFAALLAVEVAEEWSLD